MRKKTGWGWLTYCAFMMAVGLVVGWLIEPQEELIQVNTLEELHRLLEMRTDELCSSLGIRYWGEVAEVIENAERRQVLLDNYGIVKGALGLNKKEKTMIYSDIVYYPGMRMVYADRHKDESMLTKEEKKTLALARAYAQEILERNQTDFERALAVHDLLCEKACYEKGPGGNNLHSQDTAIGALLYGRCDCDGYSDAFYLLGSLVGLEVGYQDGSAGGNHMWNLVKLCGDWRMVDVTWDDKDEEANGFCTSSFAYFCFSDSMSNHARERLLSRARDYIYWEWAVFPYTSQALDGFAYCETISDAVRFIDFCGRTGRNDCHVMAKGEHYANWALDAQLRESSFGLKYCYTIIGGFTCIDFAIKK